MKNREQLPKSPTPESEPAVGAGQSPLTQIPAPADDKMKFKVAPHIVEDLGLNLYTELPRVLVEFVANAYDADAKRVSITFDRDKIEKARGVLKKQYELEMAQEKAKDKPNVKDVPALAMRTLPDDISIVVEDIGHGMSREDLKNKFLIAGRRRRSEEPNAKGMTKSGRALMGRKGLGKLAGFGVAKTMEVVSRRDGEVHATRVVLDYDQLVAHGAGHEIPVDEMKLDDGGGFEKSGTRITLSRLLYDPLKSRDTTIEHEIGDHFALIDEADFKVLLNEQPVKAEPREFDFAWPEPDKTMDHLTPHTLALEEGGTVTFQYRLRFTKEGHALKAAMRGVRVYAHKRLAAAPSLLRADTNMHGFRMTDYLDGVVHADFIDEEQADYIATDRQSLRWDAPLLADLRKFLSEQIKEACKQCQRVRDEKAPDVVREDTFTAKLISAEELSKKDERLAYEIAAGLKRGCKQGVKDPDYKEKLPLLVRGIGHGNILTAISKLAAEKNPDLNSLAVEVARLTAEELDQFITVAKGRLKAITALRKIVEAADFDSADNEQTIQRLFEKSPWLIDPTYTQFLTADQSLNELFKRLAKELGIGAYAPKNAKELSDRPDLAFLIGNEALERLVIVELKSANKPLDSDHLDQLLDYMKRAEDWLAQHEHPNVRVRGHLIGTKPTTPANARKERALLMRVDKAGPDTPWLVRDYLTVMEHTKSAHVELIEVVEKAGNEAQKDPPQPSPAKKK